MGNAFWASLDLLIQELKIEIDRPSGSAHPRYPDMIYPLDYGYITGIASMDGGDMDVWIGESGEKIVTGVILTVDPLKKDAEMKLLIGCTMEEMLMLERFHTGGGMEALLIVQPLR